MWIVRELSALFLWIVGVAGDTTAWRDNVEVYRVIPGGTVERVAGNDVKPCWADRIMTSVFKYLS